MPSFSDYIVFVDESGDHGMESIDPGYPVFVLAFCVFHKEAYVTTAAPAVLRFKFKHFGHDQVILHEHEIRKTKGAFIFLFDSVRRGEFFADMNRLVDESPFTVIASVIDKQRLRDCYANPANPYTISVGFGLERIYRHLQGSAAAAGRRTSSSKSAARRKIRRSSWCSGGSATATTSWADTCRSRS